MRAVVGGAICLPRGACPPKLLERLRRDLSFPNFEFVQRRRLGLSVAHTPEWIECLRQTDGDNIELPRGAIALLKRRADEAGIALSFDDRRTTVPPLARCLPIALRPYQADAVHAMARGVQGTVIMPPGAGKSRTALATVARIRQPALVIVHTRDLVEQWEDNARRLLGVRSFDLKAPDAVAIATVQSLTKKSPSELGRLSEHFGAVVVDEVHHAPSQIFQHVLRHLRSRYRFGLTATPEREDGLSPLLDLTFGDRLFLASHASLVSSGYLEAPEVRPINTSFDFSYRGPRDFHALMEALVTDPERNDVVANLACEAARGGHSVLVLSGRVQHCHVLGQAICEGGVHAEVLVGHVSQAKRKATLERFRSGELRVVVASTLADEGLDVPRLGRVILAYPGRAEGRTAQRLGRLMRPHPQKQGAVLFDIVDEKVPPLRRQFCARRALYRSLGAAVSPPKEAGHP